MNGTIHFLFCLTYFILSMQLLVVRGPRGEEEILMMDEIVEKAKNHLGRFEIPEKNL